MQIKLDKLFVGVFAAFFLVGAHYFQHNQGGSGLELPINLVAWIFISFLIGIGLWRTAEQGKVAYSPLLIAATLFSIALLIPFFYPGSEFRIYSVGRLVGLFGGLLFLFCLYQMRLNAAQRENLLYLVIASVIIECLFGLVQRYVLELGNPIGFNPETGRPWGIFQQPNVASTFYLSAVTAGAFLLANGNNSGAFKKGLLITSAFLCGWLIVLNASKTATISLFVVMVAISPYLFKKADVGLLRAWYIALALGIAVPMLLGLLGEPNMAREMSAPRRIIIYVICLVMLFNNVWLGTGYGSFDGEYHRYLADYNIGDPGLGFHVNVAHPHNEVFLWAVEGGFIPLAAFIGLAVFLAARYFHLSWCKGLFYLALLFPAAFHSLTEFPFYHAIILWVVFLLTLYLIETQEFQVNEKILAFTASFKLFSLLIPVAGLMFCLSGLDTVAKVTKFERTGSHQAELLQKALNPAVMGMRFEHNSMTFRLKAGIHLNLDEEIELYINWAERAIWHYPRAVIYRNLYLAHMELGNSQRASELIYDAKRLFPQTSWDSLGAPKKTD